MSKLIVHNVTTKNFMQYGNDETTFNIDQNELSLIVGKNGTGKSTLPIDALFFNWYGKPFRGIKLGELVNDTNKKEMETTTEVTTTEGRKYRIIRNRKPDKFLVQEIVDGNYLDVTPPADLKQYQKWLEEHVLRLSDDTFRQVVVLGSSSYVPFMELSTPKRRTVVEDLLMLRVYAAMNKIAKDDIKSIKSDFISAQSNTERLKSILDANKRSLDEINNRSDKFVEENQETIDKLQKGVQNGISKVDLLNDEIAGMQSAIDDKEFVKSEYAQNNDRLRDCKRVESEQSNRYKFYSDNDNCPECKQSIDKHFADNIHCEIDGIMDNLKSQYVDIDKEGERINARIAEIRVINDEIKEVTSKINDINNKISLANGKIQVCQNNITNFNNQDTTDIQRIIDESSCDYENSMVEFSRLESEINHHNALLELLKDDGIKATVINEELPLINKTIRDYLKIIDFNVVFTLDETFKENIIIDGKNRAYQALSQGQKLRLNLVLMFVWRELAKTKSSAAVSLLVMDEVCDSSMDSDAIDAMFKLMEHLINEGKQNIIVISHSVDTQSKFNVVHKVEKHNGFSTIKNING